MLMLSIALASCGINFWSGAFEFTLNDDGVSYSITGIGTCRDTDIVIPSTYKGLPVTSIGDYAFSDCDSLESIQISNGVTSIGDYAFDDCDLLTIYCEATSKPSGWDYWWNCWWDYSLCPVVWGYTGE